MILYGRHIEQVIDRDETGSFHKEIVVTKGPVPLAMVRKRWAKNGAGTRAPVLLVHGFGQNRYAWHLPARSFANHLARAGLRRLQPRPAGSRPVAPPRRAPLREASRTTCGGTSPRPSRRCRPLGQAARLARRALARGAGGLRGGARRSNGAVAGHRLHRQPVPLHARLPVPRGARALLPRPEPRPAPQRAIPLAPVGLTMRMLRRFAESPLYPIPLRGLARRVLRAARPRAAPAPGLRPRGAAEMLDMFAWATRAPLRRTRVTTTWSASRRMTCRSSSWPARTTTSRRPRACGRAFTRSRVAGQDVPRAPPRAHRSARGPGRAADDVAPRQLVAGEASGLTRGPIVVRSGETSPLRRE